MALRIYARRRLGNLRFATYLEKNRPYLHTLDPDFRVKQFILLSRTTQTCKLSNSDFRVGQAVNPCLKGSIKIVLTHLSLLK